MTTETSTEPPVVQRHDDLNVPVMAFCGVLACVLTFVIVLGVQVLYHRVANRETERKVISAATIDSDSILADQEAKLARYGWLDRAQGRTAIPIERAMEIVVGELGGDAAHD